VLRAGASSADQTVHGVMFFCIEARGLCEWASLGCSWGPSSALIAAALRPPRAMRSKRRVGLEHRVACFEPGVEDFAADGDELG
jgi:hypothetical protein